MRQHALARFGHVQAQNPASRLQAGKSRQDDVLVHTQISNGRSNTRSPSTGFVYPCLFGGRHRRYSVLPLLLLFPVSFIQLSLHAALRLLRTSSPIGLAASPGVAVSTSPFPATSAPSGVLTTASPTPAPPAATALTVLEIPRRLVVDAGDPVPALLFLCGRA